MDIIMETYTEGWQLVIVNGPIRRYVWPYRIIHVYLHSWQNPVAVTVETNAQVMTRFPATVVIDFHILLLQIVECLGFPEPKYRILDKSTNTVCVTVKARSEGATHVYISGHIDEPSEACYDVSQKAVRDLMLRYNVSVEDITSEKQKTLKHCTSLYRIKFMELASEGEWTPDVDLLPATAENHSQSSRHVTVDYLSILNAVYKQFWVPHEPMEVVQYGPDKFEAWCTATSIEYSAYYHTILSGSWPSSLLARQNAAKKMVQYLMPLCNFRVIDANYDPEEDSHLATLCNLEKQRCKASREYVLESARGEVSTCLTPTGHESRIPSPEEPPLPPKKRHCARGSGVGRFAPFPGNATRNFFQVPTDFEEAWRRAA